MRDLFLFERLAIAPALAPWPALIRGRQTFHGRAKAINAKRSSESGKRDQPHLPHCLWRCDAMTTPEENRQRIDTR